MKHLSWISLLLLHGTIVASDWPQWRGPNRDGTWTETGILSSFPSTGLIPKWKVPVGFGYSTPIIANGKLYLSDLVVEKPIVHERVLCFNARSGKQRLDDAARRLRARLVFQSRSDARSRFHAHHP